MSLDKFGRTLELHASKASPQPKLPFTYTPEGDIDFQGQKIINVLEPINKTDVTNKSYVDKALQKADTANKTYLDELKKKYESTMLMISELKNGLHQFNIETNGKLMSLDENFQQKFYKNHKELVELDKHFQQSLDKKHKEFTDIMTRLYDSFYQNLDRIRKEDAAVMESERARQQQLNKDVLELIKEQQLLYPTIADIKKNISDIMSNINSRNSSVNNQSTRNIPS